MMSYTHKPVLLQECIDNLKLFEGAAIVDGTVGLGGHAEMILKQIMPGGMLLGIDRDKNALAMSKSRLGTGFMPIHGNFFDMSALLKERGIEKVDGILLDLGVSSYQLDDASRGFSYHQDAPLDMRMDQTNPKDAKFVVNQYSEKSLEDIIFQFGEERWARRIAEFIVKQRKEKPIETTLELVEVIKQAIPASVRRKGGHPARKTFQAIRIEVNSELSGLSAAIEEIVTLLHENKRLCVITFHSLEDRIVKQTFAKLQDPCTCPPKSPICICDKKPVGTIITRKPLVASKEELEENPRARSAKLRVIEKTENDKS